MGQFIYWDKLRSMRKAVLAAAAARVVTAASGTLIETVVPRWTAVMVVARAAAAVAAVSRPLALAAAARAAAAAVRAAAAQATMTMKEMTSMIGAGTDIPARVGAVGAMSRTESRGMTG